MRNQRASVLSIAGALAISVAMVAPVVGQNKGGGESAPPVTLRFAVADGESRPSDPYVRAFVDEVASRSDGSVTIQPIWDAGADTPQGFEQGVAHLLVDGKADLALSAGRGWNDVGVTSLQALQAPFLIADDALAVAVASSPIADQLLASMADVGITGLAMWPEDLRHPVAFEPCVSPLLDPAQFAGITVRAIPSAITTQMIEALGATHIVADGYDEMVARCEIQAAESGLRQGSSLPGHPTFTGDVTFYPKYQVVAANTAVFDQLSPEQQEAIRKAALAVRDEALADHPLDADAAAEWCAEGGRVVLAGPEGVAAFEQAVQPVFDHLATDAVIANAIDAIRALKSTTPGSPGAAACDPALASPEPVDLTGFVGTDLPNGSFRAVLSESEMLERGATPVYAASNWGTKTWTFHDGTVILDQGEHGGPPCNGTTASVGGRFVRMITLAGGCGLGYDVVWRETGDGIELRVVAVDGDPHYSDMASERAAIDREWTRIDQ
jgi:TRAP-type C4-dicarboxylate transport system substrate-binding protein